MPTSKALSSSSSSSLEAHWACLILLLLPAGKIGRSRQAHTITCNVPIAFVLVCCGISNAQIKRRSRRVSRALSGLGVLSSFLSHLFFSLLFNSSRHFLRRIIPLLPPPLPLGRLICRGQTEKGEKGKSLARNSRASRASTFFYFASSAFLPP